MDWIAIQQKTAPEARLKDAKKPVSRVFLQGVKSMSADRTITSKAPATIGAIPSSVKDKSELRYMGTYWRTTEKYPLVSFSLMLLSFAISRKGIWIVSPCPSVTMTTSAVGHLDSRGMRHYRSFMLLSGVDATPAFATS